MPMTSAAMPPTRAATVRGGPHDAARNGSHAARLPHHEPDDHEEQDQVDPRHHEESADAARASGAVGPCVSNISATFFERGPMYSAPVITDTSQNSIATRSTAG